MSKKPKLIVIVGPTASGKTDLAIKIAESLSGLKFKRPNDKQIKTNKERIFVKDSFSFAQYSGAGAEIVSADSRQIYRGLDIGTAKPPENKSKFKNQKSKLQFKIKNDNYVSNGVIHRLIDIRNPNQPYTVTQYKKDAIAAIRKILARKKIPILVGGTGLYVKAVVDNLDIPKVRPNAKLREKLEREIAAKGLDYLFQKLVKFDPEAAYIVDRNNPRRVIRALEITLQTNKPFSQQRKQGEKLFEALKIGLDMPKEKLKKRIGKRVDKMIKAGLVDEVRNLVKKYPPALPAFDTIGYREIINYLDTDKYGLKRIDTDIHINPLNPHKSAYGLNEAIKDIKKNTWHYAKRQMTWFKKDKEIKWVQNGKDVFRLVRQFLLN